MFFEHDHIFKKTTLERMKNIITHIKTSLTEGTCLKILCDTTFFFQLYYVLFSENPAHYINILIKYIF